MIFPFSVSFFFLLYQFANFTGFYRLPDFIDCQILSITRFYRLPDFIDYQILSIARFYRLPDFIDYQIIDYQIIDYTIIFLVSVNYTRQLSPFFSNMFNTIFYVC